VRTRSFCSRVFRWLFYTILALELRPQFVTWSLTTLEYSDFRIKWKLLPPTVKSQPTMLGNITVSNPNLLPMWIHAASADIYYADKRGQRQLLGRGSAGNLTLYPGENFVQTFVAVEPMGVGDALSFERGGDKADGERVYLSAGTVTGALLGVLPFEINAECEQAVQASFSPRLTTIPLKLNGARCQYEMRPFGFWGPLGEWLGLNLEASQQFGRVPPSPFAPMGRPGARFNQGEKSGREKGARQGGAAPPRPHVGVKTRPPSSRQPPKPPLLELEAPPGPEAHPGFEVTG